MKTYLIVLAFCLLGFVSGCTGVKARYAYNVETDFTSFRTYAWVPGVQEKFGNPMVANHYVKAMDSQLASKGFKLDTENPDFLIRTHQAKKFREIFITLYGEKEFQGGKIAMDFVNAESNELIWEGVAEAYLSDVSNPTKVKKSVYQVVEDLLKGFPPAVKN
ncbi:MAG: DUF4136 domain-containing protein [Deltaproteobacteria bacterium]|nr:DUF4136 domain-containing protein [Deltaproteobacteria bacterium]